MMDKITDFLQKFFSRMAIPSVRTADVVEILLLAILVYCIVKWIKRTRAWIIVKGLAVLLLAWVVAYLLDLLPPTAGQEAVCAELHHPLRRKILWYLNVL